MRILYALALLAGFTALLGWLVARGLAVNVPHWKRADPERRFGIPGRRVVAGLVAFGIAGLSAAYGGWAPWAAALAAAAAAAAAAWYAGSVGREEPEEPA